jgi:hypothetical protein
LNETDQVCQAKSKNIERKSHLVENALNELIDVLMGSMSEEERHSEHLKIAVEEIFNHYNIRNLEALLRVKAHHPGCHREALDHPRPRLRREAD